MSNFYELEPAVQRRRCLAHLFRYLREVIEPYHPFLRRRYRELGIDVARLRTEDDLRRLPIIDKDDLRTDPTAFVLQPRTDDNAHLGTAPPGKRLLAKYIAQAAFNFPRDRTRACRKQSFRDQVRRRAMLEWNPVHFHASGGTTGSPVMAAYTHWELTTLLPHLAGLVVMQSKSPPADAPVYDWADRGFNLFPGAPHLAFFGTVLAKAAAGLSCFDTGGGHVIPTDRQIALFESGKFSVVLGVPSYMVHWLRRALELQKAGTVGPLSRLKIIVLGAEPVGDALRAGIAALAQQAGAHPRVSIRETLGMTEMKWYFGECMPGSGLHLEPRHYYWELLHPESRQPVAEGEPGVMVFSHIGWRGTALVRYWTGDLVKGGMRWTRCDKCGYTFPRLQGPICRAVKDFTKLKGTRVDLTSLVAAVRDTPGVRQFQCHLEREDGEGGIGRDRLVIHVLPEQDAAENNLQRVIVDRVKHATEVAPDEIIWTRDERAITDRLFTKNGIKAEYVVDKR